MAVKADMENITVFSKKSKISDIFDIFDIYPIFSIVMFKNKICFNCDTISYCCMVIMLTVQI